MFKLEGINKNFGININSLTEYVADLNDILVVFHFLCATMKIQPIGQGCPLCKYFFKITHMELFLTLVL